MRLAFVVQRYGLEINGGAEMQCRQLAERLSKHIEVEVLTTCAEDHYTWRNVYSPGQEIINGVLVRRFPVDRERNMAEFDRFTRDLVAGSHTYFDEMRWMELQGPISSGLLRFLDAGQDRYDLFSFMTYLYASTFLGLQVVPQKSILFPTAHNDPWIRFPIFRPLFHLPRALAYLSPEERDLIHRLFRNEYIPGQVLGNGIDATHLAEVAAAKPQRIFQQGSRLTTQDEFIVFVGRVDPSKGCDQLFEFFLRYKHETGSAIKLVLIGKPTMPIPDHPDIVPLGFLREEPYAWMAHARALILPSVFESLSLVVLESMGLGVPVLVNGHCDVARGHCQRSNGGLYYYSYEEFAAALTLLLSHPELCAQLGRQGQTYVQQNYAWEVMEDRFVDWVTWVARNNASAHHDGNSHEEPSGDA
jgi:glycosyltransferase involved in cell wall biosynthesis